MSRSPNLRKRSQWLDRLRRFARSKRSVAEFCQREQVSVGSFYQWRRKLHDGSTDLSDRRPPTRESFVPVHVTSETDLQVTFPNGSRVTRVVAQAHHVATRTGRVSKRLDRFSYFIFGGRETFRELVAYLLT